ncbi:hypothetical protein V6N13_004633 [Hibiscus sabdariffa]|uniref:RNase H type-1 domain-containing protein n=1 Tax=Hibiscus sabdariffa TaxID=183260 RepID=A0ABR2RZK2_9ROSI
MYGFSGFRKLSHILTLFNREWVIRICHTLREGNYLTDALAKLTRTDPATDLLFLEPPSAIISMASARITRKETTEKVRCESAGARLTKFSTFSFC